MCCTVYRHAYTGYNRLLHVYWFTVYSITLLYLYCCIPTENILCLFCFLSLFFFSICSWGTLQSCFAVKLQKCSPNFPFAWDGVDNDRKTQMTGVNTFWSDSFITYNVSFIVNTFWTLTHTMCLKQPGTVGPLTLCWFLNCAASTTSTTENTRWLLHIQKKMICFSWHYVCTVKVGSSPERASVPGFRFNSGGEQISHPSKWHSLVWHPTLGKSGPGPELKRLSELHHITATPNIRPCMSLLTNTEISAQHS